MAKPTRLQLACCQKMLHEALALTSCFGHCSNHCKAEAGLDGGGHRGRLGHMLDRQLGEHLADNPPGTPSGRPCFHPIAELTCKSLLPQDADFGSRAKSGKGPCTRPLYVPALEPWELCSTSCFRSALTMYLCLQKLNHFMGMMELCRKKSLARNMSTMATCFPRMYNFTPQTFNLPQAMERALAALKNGRRTFILKPDGGSQVLYSPFHMVVVVTEGQYSAHLLCSAHVGIAFLPTSAYGAQLWSASFDAALQHRYLISNTCLKFDGVSPSTSNASGLGLYHIW